MDFRVIRLFKSRKAVKNYKRMDDVDNKGKRIRNKKPAYLERKWNYFKKVIRKNRSFMKTMNCPMSCSRFK
uniref:Uncharacterized protein n=1 Tax=Strongyloides papillosus TaxID=174720 RepID=A0A0N5CA73_STREA